MRIRQTLASLILALLLPISAESKPIQFQELEQDLKQCEDDFWAHSRLNKSPDLDERLQDGIIMQAAGDHQRASYIFMDIVSHEEWRGRPGYQAAQLQLAKSLYEDGYYRMSQRNLLDLMKNGSGLERTEGIILLLQVAKNTGDWAEINDALANDTAFSNTPAYQYIMGRARFLQKDYDGARPCLEKAASGKDEWAVKSNYLLGVLDIQEKQIDNALKRYEYTAKSTLKFKGSEQIHELSILAIARLHYELGQWSKAIDSYQQIPETSPYFPSILYEMGWTHIRMEDYQAAKQKFELLLLAYPEDRHSLETHRLLADISRELGQYDEAVASYQKLVDEYEPIMEQMEAESSNLDSRRAQIQKNIENGQFDTIQIIPDRARSMIPIGNDINKIEGMLDDLHESDTNTRESESIIAEISAALASESNIRNLPEFSKFTHRAQDIRINMLLQEYDLLDDSLSLPQEIKDAAKQISDLPRNQNAREIYLSLQTAEREKREAQLHRLKLQSESLKQRTRILKTWLTDGHASSLTDEERSSLQAKIELFETQLAALSKKQEMIDKQIMALRSSSNGDGEENWANQLKQFEGALNAVISEHSEWAAQHSTDIAKSREILSRLDALDVSIDASIHAKVSDFRARLEREITLLELEKERYASVQSNVGATAGDVSARYWQTVYKQIRDMVLNADLGMVDIAWLLKDARSKALSTAMEERRKEREVLEQDFRQFLKESGQE